MHCGNTWTSRVHNILNTVNLNIILYTLVPYPQTSAFMTSTLCPQQCASFFIHERQRAKTLGHGTACPQLYALSCMPSTIIMQHCRGHKSMEQGLLLCRSQAKNCIFIYIFKWLIIILRICTLNIIYNKWNISTNLWIWPYYHLIISYG